jgi:hypothetical protein
MSCYFFFLYEHGFVDSYFLDTIHIVWCILHVTYVCIETKKLVYAIWYYGNQRYVNVFQKILVIF